MTTVPLPQALENNLQAYSQSALASLDPGTRKNTLSKLMRFLCWAVSCGHEMSTTWRAVTPVLLDNFVAHRLKTPSARGFWPKPDTIKRDLQAVRDWLVWNEERELTGPIRSAHTNRPLPQQDREEVHVVTQEQEDFILKRSRWIYEGSRGLRFPEIVNGKEVLHNACQTGWEMGAFRLYFLLMIRCGLRPDEALHLRWDEIYLESNPPFFKLKRMYDENDKPLRKLKTAKSEDAVSIARYVRPEDRDEWSGASEGVDLVKEIRDFKDQLRSDQKLTPFVFGRLDPFINNYTFPTDSFIWRALKYECKDNKLKAYSCRHTVGTRLAARGFSSEQIARVLRNTSRVCERYYIAGTRVHDVFDVSTGQRLQIRDVG